MVSTDVRELCEEAAPFQIISLMYLNLTDNLAVVKKRFGTGSHEYLMADYHMRQAFAAQKAVMQVRLKEQN